MFLQLLAQKVCLRFFLILVVIRFENIFILLGVTPAGAAKEGDKTIVPSASCIVGRTDSAQHVNSVPGATNHPSNINPPLLERDQINDLSLGVVGKLPSPCKDSSHNRYITAHGCP
jgi:hypothetical protein